MCRFVCCLLLLGLVGCTLAPDSTSRPAAPPEEEPAAVESHVAPTRLSPPAGTKRGLDSAAMEKLARTDPVAFINACVERHDREVRGYRVTLSKRERVGGKLYPPENRPTEVVRCSFREKPFSVRMDWKRGERLARKTLFVQGENDGKLLAVPTSWRTWFVSIARRDPTSEDARGSSRYPITEFGIGIGMRRTQSAWQRAKKNGQLHVLFNGEKRPKELDGQPCWELKRVRYARPEEDGIVEATLYFDTRTWLQVGSILKDENDRLIAAYYFTDLELNPEFPADTFTEAGLKKK